MNECKIEKNVGHGVEDLRARGGERDARCRKFSFQSRCVSSFTAERIIK